MFLCRLRTCVATTTAGRPGRPSRTVKLRGMSQRLPKGLLAAALAVALGALLTAVAVELFESAFREGGLVRAGISLMTGAAVFVAVDAALDRVVGAGRTASGAALVAAVALDGVPENLALGLEVEEQGLVLLVAIALSNFPEALERRTCAATGWPVGGCC